MKTITLTPDASGMVDWPTLSNDKKSVVTIGSFDGMHQGHQAVIRRVAELAEQEQAFSVVVLFDPRPALVHAYAAKHDGQEPPAGTPDTQALTSVNERLRAIDAIGVDYTLIVRYTMAFAAKSYRFFLGQMVGKLGMRTLVLGSDAAMGANRAGNVKAIENLALATGVFQLEVVDDFGPGLTRVPVNAKPVMPSEPGEPSDPLEGASKAERRAWSKKHQAKEVRTWSSTNVRYLLAHGRIQDANAILEENGKPALAYYDSAASTQYLVDPNGAWSAAAAQDYMTTILSAYSEANGNMVELVIANNDDMALGAIDAYGQTDWELPLVVGVDATAPALQAVAEGTLYGTVLNDAEGIARAMLDLTLALSGVKDSGDTVELTGDHYVWLSYQKVTKENLADFQME
jgi:cytidyltransferase-like protein